MKIETQAAMRNFAVIRDAIAETEAKMKEMINNVKQSDDYQAMENWLIINRQSLSELDKSIKQAAINTFNLDKSSKKPWDGVGIREITTYDYEPQKALVWSKENMPVIVYETIDSKQFEKFLSNTKPEALPEFVTVKKTPTATIAKDLSMYLEDEDES